MPESPSGGLVTEPRAAPARAAGDHALGALTVHDGLGLGLHVGEALVGGRLGEVAALDVLLDAAWGTSCGNPDAPYRSGSQIVRPRGTTRSQNGRTRPGSGLGPTIVAEVVRAHGGRVDVASADGGGAVVTVELPLSGDKGRR